MENFAFLHCVILMSYNHVMMSYYILYIVILTIISITIIIISLSSLRDCELAVTGRVPQSTSSAPPANCGCHSLLRKERGEREELFVVFVWVVEAGTTVIYIGTHYVKGYIVRI